MTTRNDLVARIQSDLERTSPAFATKIVDEINSVIDFYQKERFWFSDSRDVTFSTALNTTDYDFGTEFYKIDGATIVVGGVTTYLRRDDYDRLETSIANFGGNGQPWAYAYLNGGLRLYPAPNQPYTVRFLGHFKVPAPADGDEADNPWMNEGFELMRAATKRSLAENVLEDDNLANRMARPEARALSALRKATYDKTASGNIEPTRF